MFGGASPHPSYVPINMQSNHPPLPPPPPPVPPPPPPPVPPPIPPPVPPQPFDSYPPYHFWNKYSNVWDPIYYNFARDHLNDLTDYYNDDSWMEHNYDPKFRNRVFRRPVIFNQFNNIDEPTLEEAVNAKCVVGKNISSCDNNTVPVDNVDQLFVFINDYGNKNNVCFTKDSKMFCNDTNNFKNRNWVAVAEDNPTLIRYLKYKCVAGDEIAAKYNISRADKVRLFGVNANKLQFCKD